MSIYGSTSGTGRDGGEAGPNPPKLSQVAAVACSDPSPNEGGETADPGATRPATGLRTYHINSLRDQPGCVGGRRGGTRDGRARAALLEAGVIRLKCIYNF
jgi:hypothetical protein